jgi:hypothetical protein
MSLKEAQKALRILDPIFERYGRDVKIPPRSASLVAKLANVRDVPKVEPSPGPGLRVCLADGCNVEFYGRRKDHRFHSHACCVRHNAHHGNVVRTKKYKPRKQRTSSEVSRAPEAR